MICICKMALSGRIARSDMKESFEKAVEICARWTYNYIEALMYTRRIDMKIKVNLSLDEDTAKKLKELAAQSHRNVSQWVTDRVWENAGDNTKSTDKKSK